MDLLVKVVTFIYLHAKGIRRTAGTVLLAVAAIMIFLGRRIESFESARQLMAYYGAVFILLIATLLVALADLRAIRREFHLRKKALFVLTFSDEELKRKIREKHPGFFKDVE